MQINSNPCLLQASLTLFKIFYLSTLGFTYKFRAPSLSEVSSEIQESVSVISVIEQHLTVLRFEVAHTFDP